MQQVSRDPQQLANSYKLGRQRAIYKPTITCQFITFVFVALFGVVLLLPLPAIIQNPELVILALLPLGGVILLLIAIWGMITAYRYRNVGIVVYEHGFIFLGRDDVRVIKWEQINAVRHKVKEHSTRTPNRDGTTSTSTTFSHQYSVRCVDGTRVELNEMFPRLRELGKTIELESARYLLPKAQAILYSQQPVAFGPLRVERSGFAAEGRKALAWHSFQEISIDEDHGRVTIKQYGQWENWASFSLEQIPNVVVLNKVVKMIRDLQ